MIARAISRTIDVIFHPLLYLVVVMPFDLTLIIPPYWYGIGKLELN